MSRVSNVLDSTPTRAGRCHALVQFTTRTVRRPVAYDPSDTGRRGPTDAYVSIRGRRVKAPSNGARSQRRVIRRVILVTPLPPTLKQVAQKPKRRVIAGVIVVVDIVARCVRTFVRYGL